MSLLYRNRIITILCVFTFLITLPLYSRQHNKFSPDNTVIILDFDGIILTHGLLRRWKKIKPETISIMRRLKEGGYRIDGGTNNAYDDVQYYINKFPHAFKYFTKIKSIHTKHDYRKPHSSYYQDYHNHYADPKKPYKIFVDDNRYNIEAAKKNGFIAIYFESPEHLEQELQKLGIL